MAREGDKDDGISLAREDAQQCIDFHLQPSLLAQFTTGGGPDFFAAVHEAARKGPAAQSWLVGAFRIEQPAGLITDEYTHSQLGIGEVDEMAIGTGRPLTTMLLPQLQRGCAERTVLRSQIEHGDGLPENGYQKGKMTREKRS